MHHVLAYLLIFTSFMAYGEEFELNDEGLIKEEVYVESPTDTDNDGAPDRIYISISRPRSSNKLSTMLSMSPYSLGGNSTTSHNVDVDQLPQDDLASLKIFTTELSFEEVENLALFAYGEMSIMRNLNKAVIHEAEAEARVVYANVSAHSLGTGHSTGCPTVGDYNEALAGKAVIDWLNGRAKAYYKDGSVAHATWANGSVGMTGVSYNGTLPIMIAATGVEGLKAIVPVAAISNWYNYYRANGLVVGPGGYIGEDADELGYYIVRKRACKSELEQLAGEIGRDSGDFTTFWQDRDYLPLVKNIKAATFIIHGQSDWNVKQKHAIDLWETLPANTPKKMFLHKSGHSSTRRHGVPRKVQAWFDYFLEGKGGDIVNEPRVEVELVDGSLMTQENWPSEETTSEVFYLSGDGTLDTDGMSLGATDSIIDNGRSNKLEQLVKSPNKKKEGRLTFLRAATNRRTLISGTAEMNLSLSVKNRKAANITVALVEYTKTGSSKIITRGWADPQNHSDIEIGEKLIPGKKYQMSFKLEPKQYVLAKGSRLGVVLASTDYDYTIRPLEGTEIEFYLGENSFIQLDISDL